MTRSWRIGIVWVALLVGGIGCRSVRPSVQPSPAPRLLVHAASTSGRTGLVLLIWNDSSAPLRDFTVQSVRLAGKKLSPIGATHVDVLRAGGVLKLFAPTPKPSRRPQELTVDASYTEGDHSRQVVMAVSPV